MDNKLIYMYESISIGYITSYDLHHRGPQARGGVRSIETKLRCVTNLYHAYMELVQILVGV